MYTANNVDVFTTALPSVACKPAGPSAPELIEAGLAPTGCPTPPEGSYVVCCSFLRRSQPMAKIPTNPVSRRT